MTNPDYTLKWTNDKNTLRLSPEWGYRKALQSCLLFTGNNRSPSLLRKPSWLVLFHIATSEHQKGLGHFVTRVSVFWCEISHWICTLSFCLLTSSGLFLCVCLWGVLAAGIASRWHSPTHSREWLLIRMWVLPTHDPIWGWRHCQAALPSSSALSALCYCADRRKWQFSSFPAKWFSADSASFNSTAMQWRKRRERERNKSPRIEEHMLINHSEVLLWVGTFFSFTQKNPCYSLQGHTDALRELSSLFLYSFPFWGLFLGKNPLVLMPQKWKLYARGRSSKPGMQWLCRRT